MVRNAAPPAAAAHECGHGGGVGGELQAGHQRQQGRGCVEQSGMVETGGCLEVEDEADLWDPHVSEWR